jgi:hypothetical protein
VPQEQGWTVVDKDRISDLAEITSDLIMIGFGIAGLVLLLALSAIALAVFYHTLIGGGCG